MLIIHDVNAYNIEVSHLTIQLDDKSTVKWHYFYFLFRYNRLPIIQSKIGCWKAKNY